MDFITLAISPDLSDFTVWSFSDTPLPPYRLCLIISFFFVLLIRRETSPRPTVSTSFTLSNRKARHVQTLDRGTKAKCRTSL